MTKSDKVPEVADQSKKGVSQRVAVPASGERPTDASDDLTERDTLAIIERDRRMIHFPLTGSAVDL